MVEILFVTPYLSLRIRVRVRVRLGFRDIIGQSHYHVIFVTDLLGDTRGVLQVD